MHRLVVSSSTEKTDDIRNQFDTLPGFSGTDDVPDSGRGGQPSDLSAHRREHAQEVVERVRLLSGRARPSGSSESPSGQAPPPRPSTAGARPRHDPAFNYDPAAAAARVRAEHPEWVRRRGLFHRHAPGDTARYRLPNHPANLEAHKAADARRAAVKARLEASMGGAESPGAWAGGAPLPARVHHAPAHLDEGGIRRLQAAHGGGRRHPAAGGGLAEERLRPGGVTESVGRRSDRERRA
eukprot:CAMPEP_0118956156 /NCGR_PEP_ID=MMETSP1169-20130426/61228_1 /TAXON_ID=36882 /ORGANISM="Pyramimonas obovata, Strain CCMP722" /LENGTH=238 /DNA_ID=CAMNT_0006904135 /DNA_START=56 /DNA_END=767 /DNA_ORIENTATION=-